MNARSRLNGCRRKLTLTAAYTYATTTSMLYELLKVDAKIKSQNSCAHLARYISLYRPSNIKSTFIHVCLLNESNMLQLRLLFAVAAAVRVVCMLPNSWNCFYLFLYLFQYFVIFVFHSLWLYVYLLLIESCCASCHHCCCCGCCCYCRFCFYFFISLLFCSIAFSCSI